MNFGFINNIIREGSYIFGQRKLPKVVLQHNENWEPFLPTYEPQFGDGWDTFGCTIWGTLNAIEMLDRRLFNKQSNYSERYVANLIPVRPPGSDPHKIAEAIRLGGLVDETYLPMPLTYEEYIMPTPPSADLVAKAKLWYDQYDFKHEWLWAGNPSKEDKLELLMEALRYSPVGISVTAWNLDKGLYVDAGLPNNHWCVLVGYQISAGRFFPKVFDSYDQTLKLLSDDHHIERAKRYFLAKKEKQPSTGLTGFFRAILSLFNS